MIHQAPLWRPPATPPRRPGWAVTCDGGALWQTMVTHDDRPVAVRRYAVASGPPATLEATVVADGVATDISVPIQAASVWRGGIGIVHAQYQAPLEAWLGEPLEAWFARERNFPPLTIFMAPETTIVDLAGRVLPYLRMVEVRMAFHHNDPVVTWVQWVGTLAPPGPDVPVLTVEGHLVAL